MAGFGYASGRNKLTFGLAFDIMRYLDYFTRTNLKWIAAIGALIGFFMMKMLVPSANGTALLVATIGMALYLSYPFYLIMALTGDRSVGNIIVLQIVNLIATFVISLIVPPIAVFAGLIGFVLAIGFIYPNKMTFVDSILVYIVLGIIGILILLISGATAFGALLLGKGVAAIVPTV